ncbi:MAG: hypothetical protein WBD20_04665 [Pirellulaceae bacterium]
MSFREAFIADFLLGNDSRGNAVANIENGMYGILPAAVASHKVVFVS